MCDTIGTPQSLEKLSTFAAAPWIGCDVYSVEAGVVQLAVAIIAPRRGYPWRFWYGQAPESGMTLQHNAKRSQNLIWGRFLSCV